MGEAALPYLHPAVVQEHVDLTAAGGVRVRPRLLAVRQVRGQRLEDDRDHLVQIGAAHRPAGDPPQVELVRAPGVLPVDRVPAVDHPRADEEHVVAGFFGELAQRWRDHGARLTAEHLPFADVAGVARLSGDRAGRVAETVVVVGDRHDARTAAPADLAGPGTGQRRDDPVDDELNSVRTFGWVGEIPDAEVELQLLRSEIGSWTGHGDSLLW